MRLRPSGEPCPPRRTLRSLSALVGVALVTGLASGALAGAFSSSARGTAAGQFLKLGAGAEAVGMGEAYTALADDATAVYWNPAALAVLDKRSAVFMHAQYAEDATYRFAGYRHPMGELGGLGFGIQQLDSGALLERDETGNVLGTFHPQDFAVSAAAGRRTDLGPVGLTVKWVRSRITHAASTLSADVGWLSKPSFDGRVRFALAAQNLFGKLRFQQAGDVIPLIVRAGVGVSHGPLRFGGDLIAPRDDTPYGALGGEYAWPYVHGYKLAFRAGYNPRTQGNIDGLSGFGLGGGLERGGFSVDYAFLPLNGAGSGHRLSVGWSF